MTKVILASVTYGKCSMANETEPFFLHPIVYIFVETNDFQEKYKCNFVAILILTIVLIYYITVFF